jgi:hypothetical protein
MSKKYMVVSFIIFLLVFASLLYSQVDTSWVRRYNGPGNEQDDATSLAVDHLGNVYVTGRSKGINNYYDYATVKYNSQGIQEWVARYNGPANYYDEAYSLAVDNQGNILVTGYSNGGESGADWLTIKYNTQGIQEWVVRSDISNSDYAYDITVDNYGNCYVTGYSWNQPGTGANYTTIKYHANGEEIWRAHYNGSANNTDEACKVAVDGMGNVYVTGSSYGLGTNFDYATIKYVQAPAVEECLVLKSSHGMTKIYPNPTTSDIIVRGPLAVEKVIIYDVSGKVIKVNDVKNSKEIKISLSGIKNGIYFVKVNNEILKEKLVVTK